MKKLRVLAFAVLFVLFGGALLVHLTKPLEKEEITVYFAETKKVKKMPLETYLVGVVAGEMPANFPLEALKAQAVAARTYTLRRTRGAPNPQHPQAAVCTDPNHCQAWKSKWEMCRIWGPGAFLFPYQKIRKAVRETKGMVITYEGKLIDPVYHSTCGGRTASAKEVWGFEVPYLVSVPCPGDENSPYYRQERSFTLAELSALLGQPLTAPDLLGAAIERTASGRVKTARLRAATYTGEELRRILRLPSTNFFLRVEGEEVIFEAMGYGHGVGMCQYGARQMAKEGKTFVEILRYYYPGTEIGSLR